MIRDIGLAKAGRGDDFTDRQRPCAQRLKDRQAGVIGESAEQLGLERQGSVSDRRHGRGLSLDISANGDI